MKKERGNYLQYFKLIQKWAMKKYEISRSDLNLLIYLEPIEYFTREHFETGELLESWEPNRFFRMAREGYIDKVFKNNGRKGGHNRYAVSLKSRMMINRIYRMCDGEEDIPEGLTNNKIMKGKSYTDRMYSEAIKKFNRNKDRL